MTALVIAAPLLAALLTMPFRPLYVRRGVRMLLAAIVALLPLTLIGRVDGLSMLFAALVSALSFCATAYSAGIYSFDWGVGEVIWSRKSVYFVLLGAFWSAMLLVVLATNFPLLWLGISMTTLATAFLVGFSGERDALEAAWKYLVLCSVGLGFASLGILVWSNATGALSWTHPAHLNDALAKVAIGLMFIGFATKAGLVPMHAWLPDAHSKAPAPISALLSGVLVSCSLYAIMRVANAAEGVGSGGLMREMLLVLGTLSTLVAGILMLVQGDLKRLLAYSTVEHAGVVALALGFGGPLGLFAAVFHVLNHALAKSAAFFAAGMVQRANDTTSLRQLHGLWESGAPGRLLLATIVALCGLPPFGLFVSELLLVAAGVAAHQWIALAIGVAGIALAFVALGRVAVDIESGRRTQSLIKLPRLSLGATAVVLAAAVVAMVVPWTAAGRALGAVSRGIAQIQ